MQSVQQTYVFNQTAGAVTETVNGNWLQAYCEYLGVTQPVNSSWLQALCYHFGITQPLYGSWTIALANYYSITAPVNGTWWYALSQAVAPVTELIWNTTSSFWNLTDVNWATDTIAPNAPVWTGQTFPAGVYTPTITGTAEALSTITLTADAQVYTGQTDALGDWSVQITNPLTPGPEPTGQSYLVSVTATDSAGLISPATDDTIYIVAPNTITLTLDMFDTYGDAWNSGWFQLEQETSPGVWTPVEYNENPFRFTSVTQINNFKASGDMTGAQYYKTDTIQGTISGLYGLRFEIFEPYVETAWTTPVGASGYKDAIGLRTWTVPGTGNYRTVAKKKGSYPDERSYTIKNGAVEIASQPSSSTAWEVDNVQTTFTL
jgi:hypothetical protein